MIKAVIFDMDGVLIDSEPFWQAAEIEIFGQLGFHLTPQECTQTMGMRIDRSIEYWYDKYPWGDSPSLAEVVDLVLQRVIRWVQETGVAHTGLTETLAFLQSQGLKLAIASSSHLILIEAVTQKLGIQHYFDMLYSAEFEPYGKPHPGVYLTTAQKLGVAPDECIVIEDSLRGILAAKAAEMYCIAIPDPSLNGDPRLSIADWRLHSLEELNATFWTQINHS